METIPPLLCINGTSLTRLNSTPYSTFFVPPKGQIIPEKNTFVVCHKFEMSLKPRLTFSPKPTNVLD